MTSKEFKNYNQRYSQKGLRANALTRAVLETLNLYGFFAWRNNTVGVFDINQAVEKLAKNRNCKKNEIRRILNSCFRNSHTIKGQPDIIAIEKKTGRFIGVEIKAGNDRLSNDQKRFIQRANKTGGLVFEVRKIDDLLEIIK